MDVSHSISHMFWSGSAQNHLHRLKLIVAFVPLSPIFRATTSMEKHFRCELQSPCVQLWDTFTVVAPKVVLGVFCLAHSYLNLDYYVVSGLASIFHYVSDKVIAQNRSVCANAIALRSVSLFRIRLLTRHASCASTGDLYLSGLPRDQQKQIPGTCRAVQRPQAKWKALWCLL